MSQVLMSVVFEAVKICFISIPNKCTEKLILGWPAASRGLLLRQRMFFFSAQFGRRPYQNSGHTGGSFFFTPIRAKTVPKFRTYRRVFLFHPNLGEDCIKIQDIQEGLSFSPQFGRRPYQNSGHAGGSLFFTRILKKKFLMKKKHLLKI